MWILQFISDFLKPRNLKPYLYKGNSNKLPLNTGRCSCIPAGELSLPVVHLHASPRLKRAMFGLEVAGPGFTLPANIGDLNPAVATSDLSQCTLSGIAFKCQQSLEGFFACLACLPRLACLARLACIFSSSATTASCFAACETASGAIPASLGQLTNLTRIILGGNQLSGEMHGFPWGVIALLLVTYGQYQPRYRLSLLFAFKLSCA